MPQAVAIALREAGLRYEQGDADENSYFNILHGVLSRFL
jgi:hypothetical protein